WSELASDDAPTAYRAIWTMTDSGAQSVAYLARRVPPTQVPNAEKIRSIVADLESDRFSVRESASKELEKLGETAVEEFRRIPNGKLHPEGRRRVEVALGTITSSAPAEILRRLRAIHVLESVGSREARQILENLAKGAAAARETREAKASLRRLSQLPN